MRCGYYVWQELCRACYQHRLARESPSPPPAPLCTQPSPHSDLSTLCTHQRNPGNPHHSWLLFTMYPRVLNTLRDGTRPRPSAVPMAHWDAWPKKSLRYCHHLACILFLFVSTMAHSSLATPPLVRRTVQSRSQQDQLVRYTRECSRRHCPSPRYRSSFSDPSRAAHWLRQILLPLQSLLPAGKSTL